MYHVELVSDADLPEWMDFAVVRDGPSTTAYIKRSRVSLALLERACEGVTYLPLPREGNETQVSSRARVS